jgi:hypothetical protein
VACFGRESFLQLIFDKRNSGFSYFLQGRKKCRRLGMLKVRDKDLLTRLSNFLSFKVCKPFTSGTWVTEAVKEWGDY